MYGFRPSISSENVRKLTQDFGLGKALDQSSTNDCLSDIKGGVQKFTAHDQYLDRCVDESLKARATKTNPYVSFTLRGQNKLSNILDKQMD